MFLWHLFSFFGSVNLFLQALLLDKISVVSSNNQRKFEKGSPGGAWKRNHTLHTYLPTFLHGAEGTLREIAAIRTHSHQQYTVGPNNKNPPDS